jgi:hypothetical protein
MRWRPRLLKSVVLLTVNSGLTGYRCRMKLAAIALGLLLGVGMLASPASAEPDWDGSGSRPGVTPTSRCVTPSEFYSLDRFKTTREEAERILDWKGRSAKSGVNTWRWRYYRGCNGTWTTSKIGIRYGNHLRIEDAMWLVVG